MGQKLYFRSVGQSTLHGLGASSISWGNKLPETNLRCDSIQLWCTKDLSKKLPECNMPVTEMLFVEAPVVYHEFRWNQQQNCKKDDNRKYFQTRIRTFYLPSQGQRSIHCGKNINRRCKWPSKGYYHHLRWNLASDIWCGSSRRQQNHYTGFRNQVCPQSNYVCK